MTIAMSCIPTASTRTHSGSRRTRQTRHLQTTSEAGVSAMTTVSEPQLKQVSYAKEVGGGA